jgi:rubredoxin
MLCDAAMATRIAMTHGRHTSSNFLRCATLTPNMLCMVLVGRGYLGYGATRKGGRMRQHGTAPKFSIPPSNVSRVLCPECQDLIIAATKSQHVSINEVWHWWACETCGHEFRTTARLQSSPLQSVCC